MIACGPVLCLLYRVERGDPQLGEQVFDAFGVVEPGLVADELVFGQVQPGPGRVTVRLGQRLEDRMRWRRLVALTSSAVSTQQG